MPAAAELTETEAGFKERIEQLVEDRAAAVRRQQELTNEIAAISVDARRAGVKMASLAKWIKVLNPKTGELRSISRQAVDQLVAAYEGRERVPRRPAASSNGTTTGAINPDAFG